MKMLDTNKEFSILIVDEYEEVSFHIPNEWLDLSLQDFSEKLDDEYSKVYDLDPNKKYLFVLHDYSDTLEETEDLIDLYIPPLIDALLTDKLKWKSEHWGSKSEGWEALNLTEMSKRNLLNYESLIKCFNIKLVGKENQAVYILLEE